VPLVTVSGRSQSSIEVVVYVVVMYKPILRLTGRSHIEGLVTSLRPLPVTGPTPANGPESY